MTREDLLAPTTHPWLQICPNCRQLWFIGEAQAADDYRCQDCGQDFVIGYEHLPPLRNEGKAERRAH